MSEAVDKLIAGNQEAAEKHRIAYGKEAHDLAIDHCIKTMKDIWDREEIYFPMRQEMIIKALNNLKNNK